MTQLKYAVLAMVAAALPLGTAFATTADSVIGKWRTPSRNGVVEITRCGASVCGRLVDSDHLRTDPELRDAKNKDAAKRSRKLKDLQILGGFTRTQETWTGGTIYNPEDGATYKATITPAGNNALKLKGCITWPLCKTQNWTRIQ